MADKRIPAAQIRAAWIDPRLTTHDAAKAVGLSRSNLWRRARALGLPPRKVGNRNAIPDQALFARMWAAGVNARFMAEAFGCHFLTISQTAKRLGLPPRCAGGRKARITVEAFWAGEAEARLAQSMPAIAAAENAALRRLNLEPGVGR